MQTAAASPTPKFKGSTEEKQIASEAFAVMRATGGCFPEVRSHSGVDHLSRGIFCVYQG